MTTDDKTLDKMAKEFFGLKPDEEITTYDKTIYKMTKEFVGLTPEEKVKIGCDRGYFDILVNETDNQEKYMRDKWKKICEEYQKMQDKINYLIKLKQQQQQVQ